MRVCPKSLILLFVFASLIQIVSAQILDVHIKNIQHRKGQLCVAIFDSQKSFNNETTYWDTCICKKNILNNEFHIQIPIHSGRFGLSVLDDEDSNGKMEYNFLGIPREGFGFSGYLQKGISKPKFEDFEFYIGSNEKKLITVILKYF